ncbi:McrB family protein [Rubritalea sp.]|uniref:McrB family protein n=1 Tax=Rubritalea sp. TaxID=2109375 RepID=UPI003EF4CDCC
MSSLQNQSTEVIKDTQTTPPLPHAYWLVGASYGSDRDQTERFTSEGIWQNGHEDKYAEDVKSMKPGDRIAIKATYTRKNDLPFNNRGHFVSCMRIKATGTITKNHGDGQNIEVEWEWVSPEGEDKVWYFYTLQGTVWRPKLEDWAGQALVDFAFNDIPQDIDRFRNHPYWHERFGDHTTEEERFKWTVFYEAVADALLKHRDDRKALINFIHNLAEEFKLSYIQDKELNDICPFTVFGVFNRGYTSANRSSIATALANFLEVTESVPQSFEGIPILNNQKSWFFAYEENQGADDIETLWEMFATALSSADSINEPDRSEFIDCYNRVTQQRGVGWNITMGLYWIRPWNYLTLDAQSQSYITNSLGIEIEKLGAKKRCSAANYLKTLDTLTLRFKEDAFPVHSFPDLSLAAFNYEDNSPKVELIDDEMEHALTPIILEDYTINDIISDGSFMERKSLEAILERLRTKKNLILQGPPGTGKTWLAKRLAYALMGAKHESKLRAVQFHPNLSYEDFIRGWRPSGEGKLTLVDGPFLDMIKQAQQDPATKHVIVIEEINRGNPAQIFGEMLTLLEADKRTPREALELSYSREVGEKIHIPDNLYVIGTMNIADRSLALVDLALRRRFAFITLEPIFGKLWHEWVNNKARIPLDTLKLIEDRLLSLNTQIADDRNLGAQFKVGHSYVTPAFNTIVKDSNAWFRSVVETEIGPLLEEYWFDDSEKASRAKKDLLADF